MTVPLATLVWLWPQDRRRCVAFLTSLALVCLMLFAAIEFGTQAGFLRNAIMANVMPFSLNRALEMLARLVLMWPFALLAALLVLAQGRWRTTPPRSG